MPLTPTSHASLGTRCPCARHGLPRCSRPHWSQQSPNAYTDFGNQWSCRARYAGRAATSHAHCRRSAGITRWHATFPTPCRCGCESRAVTRCRFPSDNPDELNIQVAEAQSANAGLTSYFERIFSADNVRHLKPAPEPYQMVAQQLGVDRNHIRLIAAHAWDIAGALRAGCMAAFVARPGAVLDPLVPKPDIAVTDSR